MGPVQLRVPVRLEVWIFLWCLLSDCTEAGLRIAGSNSSIHALLGGDAILPCMVTYDDKRPQPELDLSRFSMRWDRKSPDGSTQPVYMLMNQNPERYRDGSDVDIRGFKRGNASLILRNVQIRDEGGYICTVIVTPDKVTSQTTLLVSAKPSVRLTSYEVTVEPGHERSVTCEVTKFYPKSITLQWYKLSRDNSTRTTLKKEICIAENNDGTFNGSSHMMVNVSGLEEDGDVYVCRVSHRALATDTAANFTLTVTETGKDSQSILNAVVVGLLIMGVTLFIFFKKDFPIVCSITVPSQLTHGQEAALSCRISTFIREPLQIIWLKEDLTKQEPTYVIYEEERTDPRYSHTMREERDHLYHCCSTLTFRAEVKKDHEKKYICMVYCPKTSIMKKAELQTFVTVAPILEPITSNHDIYYIGQQMELSCRIHSFHPSGIATDWHTDARLLPTTDIETHMDEDGLFNTISVLRYNLQMGDFGRTFRCTVNHQSLDTPKTVEWTLQDLRAF